MVRNSYLLESIAAEHERLIRQALVWEQPLVSFSKRWA
jgi:hypothetical protein